MTKVITYGTFDLLHFGHIRLLERAKALGDYLIVGITSDDYDRTRGKINNQQSLMERIAAVEATGLANEIIVEEYEGQKIDDIRRYGVDIFTVGSDWAGKFDYLNEFCKVIYLERTDGVSSTKIRTERRKIRFGIIGNLSVRSKIEQEIGFVNGVELVDCDENFSNIDAVYVASMPANHFSDVKRALDKGKHVICESPIALSKLECSILFRIAEERHLILADAIKTAYSTAFSRLCLIAKSGKIGDILSVDSVCTSLHDEATKEGADLSKKQNSICAWGPIAMLPIFQLLGTTPQFTHISSMILNPNLHFDGFSKIDFQYPNAIASAKVAKAAKAEGELIVTGSLGYIYVPAPWWKTDYFEVRFEDPNNNKRYFYQLDGDGIRYELVAFLKAIQAGSSNMLNLFIKREISEAICGVMEKYEAGDLTEFGARHS